MDSAALRVPQGPFKRTERYGAVRRTGCNGPPVAPPLQRTRRL
jgi:hypothetical protein